MILIKYTLKQMCKNHLIILILLFLVCICQKLIKILGIEHNTSISLIILYIILNIPELSKLLIPFSLFLSVIITYYKLHIHNEILAMYSCGMSKYILIQSVLLYSSIVLCIAFTNLFWLYPYCKQYQDNVLEEVKKHTYFNIYIDKKFQLFSQKNLALLINNINNKKLENVFIANKQKNGYNNTINIITAEQGNIYNNLNHSQAIILNKGTYYKIDNNQKIYTNICITNFSQYKTLIDYNFNFLKKPYKTIDQMSINQLWHSSLEEAYLELSWRLTLLISILIMPTIALLLIINIIYKYLPNFLLSIILYIIFFLSHILLRFYYISSPIHSIIEMWLINLIYLILIYLINIRKTFLLKSFF